MSSPTSRMPACSVAGCVDTAEVRVQILYGDTVHLCARHGRPLRAVALEVLADRTYRRLVVTNGSPNAT